ncbi:MAG: 1-deoxy-D-xylulose-5-phosphate reductoisomerase [Chloroflexi bacterium]|nr:1-deoxy-D-xylulose-5-phosphate reductoisomerase [Chloroflexota bacterium]
MKRVAILGSTGSVGTQTLDVLERLPGAFVVVALAAGRWSPCLASQVERWRPATVGIADPAPVREHFPDTHVLTGKDALRRTVEVAEPDVIVVATPGLTALAACLEALQAGRVLAMANKEALVAAGALVMRIARDCGGTIVPVDSEHSGIWQCLQGEEPRAVAGLTLTSSGGAFRDTPVHALATATPEEALRHPTWSMGPKITIDSATLMNKGLEIIEASWLFDIPPAQVAVVLHRQSIIHALVEFIDGTFKAQLAVPDMRLPIANALTYPERVFADLPRLDIARLGMLSFEPVDDRKYPSIEVARRAAEAGGTHPAVLNAANEVAVERFLAGDVRFTDIVPLVATTLDRYAERSRSTDEWASAADSIEAVLTADAWARATCRELQP